jgi:acetyltransferase-like isoleucine patch superfamily enzyme
MPLLTPIQPVGNHGFIGTRPWFSGSQKAPIQIGSFVMFGLHVTRLCGDHDIDRLGLSIGLILETEKSIKRSQGITIEDDVWVGANATILKGVTIGRGAVIAAAAVVTKHVPPFSIVAGTPARVVRERFSACDLTEHIRLTDEVMATKQG